MLIISVELIPRDVGQSGWQLQWLEVCGERIVAIEWVVVVWVEPRGDQWLTRWRIL